MPNLMVDEAKGH